MTQLICTVGGHMEVIRIRGLMQRRRIKLVNSNVTLWTVR